MAACLSELAVWMKWWVLISSWIHELLNLFLLPSCWCVSKVCGRVGIGFSLARLRLWILSAVLNTVSYYRRPTSTSVALDSTSIYRIAFNRAVKSQRAVQCVSHIYWQFFVCMSANRLETQWLLYIWKICIFSHRMYLCVSYDTDNRDCSQYLFPLDSNKETI